MPSNAPFFIVGPPRSGTSLLRFCLNRHSRLDVPFETSFFLKIDGNRRLFPARRVATGRDILLDRLYGPDKRRSAEYEQCRDAISRRLSRGVRSYREVAEIVFNEFARCHGKVRWGEKTPLHVMHLGRIFALFPEARIIHIRREPKNTIASYLASPALPNSFSGACATYLMCRNIGRRYSGRVTKVRYEELTTDPERVLKSICDYLGEDFESQMSNPRRSNSSYDKVMLQHDAGIGIYPEGGDKWKSVLTRKQAAFIDWITCTGGRFTLGYLPLVCLLAVRFIRMYLSVLKTRAGYFYVLIGLRRALSGR